MSDSRLVSGAPAPGDAGDRAIDLEQLFLNGAPRIGRAPFVFAILALLAALALYERLTPSVVRAFSAWLVDLLLIFSASAVLSKRLHDLGRAGWWSGFGLLAFVNVWPAPRGLGWLFLGLLTVGAVWLGATPGQRGFNRFGPPARGR